MANTDILSAVYNSRGNGIVGWIMMTAQQLAEKNISLAHYFANQHKCRGLEYEEILSIAFVGLVKAANAYDESKGCAFTTLAGTCIKNEIFMRFRKGNHYTVSLDEPVSEGIVLEDTLIGDDNFEEGFIERDALLQAMNGLSDLEQQVIKYRYMMSQEYNQDVLAGMIGISQSYLCRVEKRTLRKLRNMITV